MTLAETAQQMLKLGINDNRIHLSMIENVLNILLLQPVIDGNLDSTRGSNTVSLSCWTTTGFVVIADAIKVVAR